MSHSLRRHVIYLGPFIACMAAYALLPEAWRGVAALLAALIALAHAATGDEVERHRAARAAALAFGVAVILALSVPLFGLEALLIANAHLLWAGLFGLYMAGWVLAARSWF